MKHDVNEVLQRLIREKAELVRPHTKGELRHRLTSMGVPLERQDDGSLIVDLTGVKVFAGLSTFVRLLTNDVIEQCSFGVADVMVRRKVDSRLTPELASLGIDWVMVYARTDAAESLPWYHERFGRYVHLVFSSIQTERWGGLLFPDFFDIAGKSFGNLSPPALLFPFHLMADEKEGAYFLLLEYSRAGRFIRITVEDAAASRLQLKHIPHRVVDNLESGGNIRDIQHIAENIYQGILRECHNYRAEYKEIPDRQPEFFAHLRKSGLAELSTLLFRWSSQDIQAVLLNHENDFSSLLDKMVLMLEDLDMLTALASGNMVEMRNGSNKLYLDVSRHGSCLNISLNEPRKLFDMDYYLDQMPLLLESVDKKKGLLQKVSLFLIHHITAEVLGLIRAFEKAGCSPIKTFFVKYGGIVPDEYLETLLSLPQDTFGFYSLQKVESGPAVRGSYILSRQYSPITGLEEIDRILQEEQPGFLESMRIAAGHLFFMEALECKKHRRTLLLVEDGGYLAPLLNRFCLENRTLGEALIYFRVQTSPLKYGGAAVKAKEIEMPLSQWLADIVVGSAEHTRNGFDNNLEVMKEFGRLQFPVCSIAVSGLKRGEEARECSTSILNAIENVLHRLGLTISKRRVLILGSRGAIAGNILADLSHRVGRKNICGVDIAASEQNQQGCVEVQTPEEIDEEILYDIDLVIGVVGKSIIKKGLLEKIVLRSRRKNLFFASGSTKTLEFEDLEDWLDDLKKKSHPEINGKAVNITVAPLRDLQTGMLQGSLITIDFDDKNISSKNIYLFGGLTPVNFLYYGIPREIIDEVMSQLLRVSIGLVGHHRKNDKLPPALLAVDYEIDVDADLSPTPRGFPILPNQAGS